MTEESSEMKSVRVLAFSGKAEDWDEWSTKFETIASQRGYYDVMTGKTPCPKASLSIDEKTPNGTAYVITSEDKRNELKEARKANTEGYRDLTLSTTTMAFKIVKSSKTEDLPAGDLKLAWANLKAEWEPTTTGARVNLVKELVKYKLENVKYNITDWLTNLDLLRVRLLDMKHNISDEYLITHILANLPAEYNEKVSALQTDLRKGTLDLKELKIQLKEKYDMMAATNGWTEEEMALMTVVTPKKGQSKGGPFRKPFKGSCHHCGKQGHKSQDCWDKDEN